MGDSEVYFDFFYNMLRGKNELGTFNSKIMKKLSNRGMVHHTYKDEDKDLFDIRIKTAVETIFTRKLLLHISKNIILKIFVYQGCGIEFSNGR